MDQSEVGAALSVRVVIRTVRVAPFNSFDCGAGSVATGVAIGKNARRVLAVGAGVNMRDLAFRYAILSR